MKQIAEEQQPWTVEHLLLPHTLGRGYYFYPASRPSGADRAYKTNRAFWTDVLADKVIAERTVSLHGFNVFEWIPRNPGLYHTDDAAMARVMALQFIREVISREHLADISAGTSALDHAGFFRRATQGLGTAREVIYTPQGKISMLQGGIGCVRLSPVELKKGGIYWFMSATSTNAPDEGIPLLMPDEIYQTVIDEIRESGYAHGNLVGKTKFVQKEFSDLYSQTFGIPRVYIEVSDIQSDPQKAEPGSVSVAASFLSRYEGYPKIYASYVTFDPGLKNGRQSAGQWLKQEYVERLYHGSVLTDFDQQAPLIANTLFSLDQVLTSPDLAKHIANLREKYGQFNWDKLETYTLSFHTHEENVMVNVNATGRGNIINIAKYMVGVTATVNGNVDQSNANDDIKELIKKLGEQIAAAGSTINPKIAQQMGSDIKALSEEIKNSEPRRKWYEISLSGLKEAAEAVGEVGKPILETVVALMSLLLP